MKKIAKYISCVVLVVLLAGCKSAASSLPPPSTETIKEKTVTVTIHDTILKTEKDSSFYKAYIECINGKPVLKNPKSKPGKHQQAPKVDLKGNQLNVDCVIEAQELFHQWKETYIKENQATTIKIPYPVVQPLTWWQTTQIWLGRILIFLLLALIIAVILRFKKII